MPDRPDDRRSRAVWLVTVAAMVIISIVMLLIIKPWVNTPNPHHHKVRSSTTAR